MHGDMQLLISSFYKEKVLTRHFGVSAYLMMTQRRVIVGHTNITFLYYLYKPELQHESCNCNTFPY